ncbi:MAG: amidohydrolase family protein [Pseudomonadota bacterium]
MPSCPIIDSHLHLWDPSALRIPWLEDVPSLNRRFDLSDFDAAIEDLDVEALVFLECDVAPDARHAEAEIASKVDPRVRGVVASAALERGAAVEDELAPLTELSNLRGIRRLLQGEADPAFCLRPEFLEGVRTLGRFGLSFDICVKHTQLESVVSLAQQCPDVPMVLDHLGKPDVRTAALEPWATQIRALSRCPNVWLKMSGLATEADHANWTREQLRPYILNALEAFGCDRTMFGGDWPVATLAIGYRQWIETLDWAVGELSETDERQLYRDTAAAFYRL